MNRTDLKIAIDEPIGFEVIVVLAEGIDHALGHFQPAHVEEKLNFQQTIDCQVTSDGNATMNQLPEGRQILESTIQSARRQNRRPAGVPSTPPTKTNRRPESPPKYQFRKTNQMTES